MSQALEVGSDREYDEFLSRVQSRFMTRTESGSVPLFETSVENLFSIYLGGIPEDRRQHHTCHCCRRFIDKFGGLVTIDENGNTVSAIWDVEDAPEDLKGAVAVVVKAVARSKVSGVFLSSEVYYGTSITGPWHHLSISPPVAMRHKDRLKTAFQSSAEKLEDLKTVRLALTEFTQPMLEQAVKLLKTEAMYRSEKVLGQAEWLLQLQIASKDSRSNEKSNILWRAIATAPSGFCHPRASMIGTLLEDIASGMDFDSISRRFASKMHPLQYQRPTAAPTAGAIAEAEKVFTKLSAEGSLARRFCRLDEVKSVWRPQEPKAEQPAGKGVFGHLKPKGSAIEVVDIQTPAGNITWDKFRRTILPEAEQIELFTPEYPNSYGALVTAVNADAPPILQWDSEVFRNPVSWYLWHSGSSPSQYGLGVNQFHKVSAICLGPSQWRDEADCPHQASRIMLIIDGAKETRMTGSAIFPETLRSEFHGIRSVIEAYSRSAEIEGMKDPHACGLILSKSDRSWEARIRVTIKGLKTEYRLDRWD